MRAPLRFLAIAFLTTLLIGALGLLWHVTHFGLTDRALADRLESDVRQLIAERTRQVRSLAERVARYGDQIEAASFNQDAVAPLFARLQTERTRTIDADRVSITVYAPFAPRGEYRVLAWSDGAAEDVRQERLAERPALFVTPGTGGLLLVYVQPVDAHGRRAGVAVAETVLAAAAPIGAPADRLDTAYGPVTIELPLLQDAAGELANEGSFSVADAENPRLLHVRYSIAALQQASGLGYGRVGALAALPLVAAALLMTGRLLARRIRERRWQGYLLWSAVAASALVASALALGWFARILGAPAAFDGMLKALAALAAATLLPVSIWWRPGRRLLPAEAPVRFALEHLLGGGAVAAGLFLLVRVSRNQISTAPLSTWAFPLFPLDGPVLLLLVTRLFLELALCWTLATLLALLTMRWRIGWRRPRASTVAIVFWFAPAAAVLTEPLALAVAPPETWLPIAAAIAAFALLASSLRQYYRHTTQAMRLLMLFGALFLPAAALYPMAAYFTEQMARALVTDDYAPVIADQPQRVREALARAQTEVDAYSGLDTSIAVALASPVRSRAAFQVWKATSLSETRLTSAIELYGPDGTLVSRFALNVPEYTYNAAARRWTGTECTWQAFDEPRQLGAEVRRVFHAERGLCSPEGRLLGAVIVHIVLDYQALPFITSATPFGEMLPSVDTAPADTHLPDLQTVVYGWSLNPLAPSGQMAWPVTDDIFQRLYRSRDAFWQVIAGERPYNVFFTSNRAGIYAIGYPVVTAFDHATRLAEAVALCGVVFVVLLIGAAVYGPFAGRSDAPLRVLFNEIRTSFYRKLFLFFVFAAIVPVLMFALAFGAYMQNKFRADVSSEAVSVVTIARRVLEELAAGQRPEQAAVTPSDDVMVWIGQVIHQQVNLYEGSQLKATSQRDLFESGLLPMRTPAKAYISIALDRLPSAVTDDRLGSFKYLVAAAPVSGYGRDAVISVPLALRQREIERQINDLNRGVLVGAVVVILFAAGLGASVAGRVSDPVARLTRATRQIAAGQLDVRIVADTADELRRLVDDFNSMAETLGTQRTELARTNQLKAWNEMARQVAHEIKNPLTPIQLSAEHLQRVHEDQGRPLGVVFDQCITTVLRQVKLLRQIAAEFSNFAGEPTPRPTDVVVHELVEEVVAPYRTGLDARATIRIDSSTPIPPVHVDRTLIARALTNVVENALHAMPNGGTLLIQWRHAGDVVAITLMDTGVGMDAEAVRRAFEPYFSTRTAGSGLGLANAKRNIELCGGTIALTSERGRGTVVTVSLPAAAAPAGPAGA